MKVDVLLGLQWGDEGKGKVVDVLTPKYDVVTRFQGGPNAGHTLEFNGEKYVLRSVPSGIFQGDKVNIIGNGVVLDPALFKAEAEALAQSGHDLTKRLYISKKAHLILPTHRLLDAAYEAAKGKNKVGPTTENQVPRNCRALQSDKERPRIVRRLPPSIAFARGHRCLAGHSADTWSSATGAVPDERQSRCAAHCRLPARPLHRHNAAPRVQDSGSHKPTGQKYQIGRAHV